MNSKDIEELRKLKTLLNEGIITKEEFIEARNKLLYNSESKSETSNYESYKTEEDSLNIQKETNSEVADYNDSSASSSLSTTQTVSGNDTGSTDQAAKKGYDDKSKTFAIIVGVAIAIIALFAGLKMWSDHQTMVAAREALPGTWTYSFSDEEKSGEYVKYTEDFTSKITFDNNGYVEIYIGQCVCRGQWDLNADGEDVYITISDEEIIKGESKHLSQVLDNLKYSTNPYYEGYELYWYTWDGEHVTNWHYYEHE